MVVAPLVPILLPSGSRMLLGPILAVPGAEVLQGGDCRDGGRRPQQASGSHASAGLFAAHPAWTDGRTPEDVCAACSMCVGQVEL